MQVVALGGGGFSTHGRATAIDRYVLDLAGVPWPRICFVGTASADDESYYRSFEAAFSELGAVTTAIMVDDPLVDVIATLDMQHVVYVGGGDPIGLLAAWQLTGIGDALVDAARQGVVMCGTSAGATCWFELVLDDGSAQMSAGLGLVGGALVPHRATSDKHRQYVSRLVASGLVTEAYAVDEEAALRFDDGALVDVVAAEAGSAAEHITWSAEGARVEHLPATSL